MTCQPTSRDHRGAAYAALAGLCLGIVLAGGPAGAQTWSEFGTPPKKAVPEGPEIREPFFAFLVGLAEADSLGSWSREDLEAFATATGRGSRFPLDEVVRVTRARPDSLGSGRYGVPIRAEWHVRLAAPQDHPMPYSILGYHPGSLRLAGEIKLAELAPMRTTLTYTEEGRPVQQPVDDMRIYALEKGYVVLDADGWLDALLGSALDDSWTQGFVTCRIDGRLIGLGVSLGRNGRRIYGEFDFRQDEVLPHGRPLASAISSNSRNWLNVETGTLPDPWHE